jgi:hypothetical protein
MSDQEWTDLFGETARWNRFEHGTTWPAHDGGTVAPPHALVRIGASHRATYRPRGVDPEERNVVQFRHSMPIMTQGPSYDDHAYQCGGVEGIGMSLDERARERQGGMRVVALAVIALIIAACILAELTPRMVDSLADNGAPAEQIVWLPAGDCLQNAITGALVCPVTEGT